MYNIRFRVVVLMLSVDRIFCRSVDSVTSEVNKSVMSIPNFTVNYNATTVENDIASNVTPRNFEICEPFFESDETQLLQLHGYGVTVIMKIF